jgi:hypothetical protein
MIIRTDSVVTSAVGDASGPFPGDLVAVPICALCAGLVPSVEACVTHPAP